ncbi:anti-sigma-I factor RsgI family protein [Fictibacillus phosphorivorans]|uniref:anti-sigma-I factor RsgI family protein n=1 Tax=Fictibacillus phosphorivorans TaxID=1221500 RepID=UPI00203EB93D|nr:anti-sigma factor domain-containing protein [Fictibacillus phosphorivorans]MCM3718729.1 anti-sigma factor domain-containing protein [Fictibacillus phosphorivorans]MCM3776352.1 anti-sigma factor domain-containing protein [Fictibacillus phosphorivorans]
MNKAIIVEVNSRHLIVLAEGGEFKKIKNTNQNYTVGQEISIPVLQEEKSSFFSVFINWKTVTATALAIFLLFFQVFSPLPGSGAYAYVGMEMDPSLELEINEAMKVLDISTYNEQGKNVLEHMGEWKNKEIGYVTNLIFEACENLGYLKAQEEVLITTTLSEDIPEDKEKEMKKRVNEVMNVTAKKKSVEMTTIVMSSEERKKAKKMNISPGRYAIYTAAKKSGIKISAKEVSTKTIKEISEKVGPIKELLEENAETITASTHTEEINQVYEPLLPILDDKKEAKAEKETSVLPVQEKEKTIRKDQSSAKPQNARSVVAAEPKKEKQAQEPAKQDPAKKEEKPKNPPLTATAPGKENTVQRPVAPKDVPPAAVLPKQEKPVVEEKPHKEKPKEEKPVEEKPKAEPQPSEPKETVPEKPEPTTKPGTTEWIYIEIVLDNLVITVRIKSDAHVVKDEIKKEILAIINQNHLALQNHPLIASTEEVKNSSINDQTITKTASEEKQTESEEAISDCTFHKAS